VPPDERFTFENHSVVTLKFENVFGLKLDGFNGQNAIFGLHIVEEGTRKRRVLRDFE
jgi:hypothetical protein